MPAPSRMKSRAIALLGLVALCATPACAADIVLRCGSFNTEGTAPYDQALVPFARAIEEDSGGRIEVALKPVGGYGKPAELFDLVEKGEIEMAATVPGYTPGRFPQSSVMELPFMFQNAIAATEAMMALYKEGLLSKDYASVKVLGLYTLPPYPIFTTGKKIQTLRDFRGLRVRTPSITAGVALAKLGAVPLGIPLNTIGESIASGYVDAIAFGWDSTTTIKGAGGKVLSDQFSVAVDAQLAGPALMLVMNRAAWDKLPDDLKEIVERRGVELAMTSARIREAQESVTRKRLASDPRFTVLNFSDEQRAELQRLTAPVIAEWKASMAKLGIDGERLYARAKELITQYKVAAK